MQWLKHDTDAHRDAKLVKVQMKYGLEGYGLYWFIIELIAADISEKNLTFELEHDAEIIAHQTGLHFERVQEMMTYMVNLGLFENSSGTITCLKLLKRLDQSMSSNRKFREFVATAKQRHDAIMIPSDKVMQEVEVDKKRKEKNKSNPATYKKLDLTDIDDDLLEPVKEFIDHRNNLKKPLTQQALSRFISTASNAGAKVGMSTVDVIKEAIDAGWQSVKAEWLVNRMNGGKSEALIKTRSTSIYDDLTDRSWV